MEQENIVTYTKVEGASTDSLEELPMVVIPADELYREFLSRCRLCHEKLQIKRSRLTQISGKDSEWVASESTCM